MAEVFTVENFENEVLNASLPVLVDFYADWCGPCKMMAPVVDQLSEEYQGKLKVGKLNVDQNEELAVKYGVMTIPTLIFIKDGKEVQRVIGVQDKKKLVELFNQIQ